MPSEEDLEEEVLCVQTDAEYADLNGPAHDTMNGAVDPNWIAMTPMVRVLLEMPEEDALWLRRLIAEAIQKRDDRKPIVYTNGRALEMHVKEILLYG